MTMALVIFAELWVSFVTYVWNTSHIFSYMDAIIGHIFTNMGRIMGQSSEPERHVPIQARSSFICSQEAAIVIEGSSSPVSGF